MTDNNYKNIRNIDSRINKIENQYVFLNDLGKKLDTVSSSLDELQGMVKENSSSMKELSSISMSIEDIILELVKLYKQLKENLKIIKTQIKDLESKKNDINKKIKKLRKELMTLTTKVLERDDEIKLQFNKINNRNNYYKKIIKLLRIYDSQIRRLIPEDYEYLKGEIISKLEYMVENFQYIKKALYTKSKRLERIDENFNRIRDMLKKYSSINKDIPNMINEVRKEEGIKKDVFFKQII